MGIVIIAYVGGKFVYVEAEKIGESYVIARIMQERETKILLNSFFRPAEVLSGKNFKERLLVASTQSKWVLTSKIIGECRVLHISQIQDMGVYCKDEDNFYFEQLYDLYAKEIYDVARSNLVRVPADLRDSLLHFPFIYVETGHLLDIINGTGWCGICKDYCMPLKAEEQCFECCGCKKRFHFHCFNVKDLLDPNASMCNVCYKANKKVNWVATIESDSKLVTSFNNFEQVPMDVHLLNLEWPFRYFGIHSNEESAADVDSSIVFPRCSVKVGAHLQVKIPKYNPNSTIEEEDKQENNEWLQRYGKQLIQQLQEDSKLNRNPHIHLKYKLNPKFHYTTVQDFINTLCNDLGDAKGSCQYRQYLYELLHKHQFDFYKTREALNFSLQILFSNKSLSAESILPLNKPVKWLESILFDQFNMPELVKEKGHVLHKIADSIKVPVKSLCQYFPMYKKTDEQRESYDFFLRKHMNTSKFNKSTELEKSIENPQEKLQEKPNDKVEKMEDSLHDSDEHTSENESSLGPESEKIPHCDNCFISNPTTLIPTSLFQGRHSKRRREQFCKDCGTFWLKYATAKQVPRERKSSNKTVLFDSFKRRRNSTSSFQSVPPRSIIPHVPCGVCLDDIKTDEHHTLLDNSDAIQCADCKMVCHRVCYDITYLIEDPLEWKCDVCIKQIKKESCCLCGKVDQQVTAMKAFQNDKAHAVCLYTNDSFMFSKLNLIREPILYKEIVDTQELSCFYCHQLVGWKTCCVMQGCQKWFHPVCAVRSYASFTFFDKAMRFFCCEHMTPMTPYDLHDPINTIKSANRATKMIKIQEELRYKRTELGIIELPNPSTLNDFVMYCDPSIDPYKAASKRVMRKSSAHMKVPVYPNCIECHNTSYPTLWDDEQWHCIRCIRTSK